MESTVEAFAARAQRLAECPGIGVRIKLERVIGSDRNQRPDGPGMRTMACSTE
jgi:hypothetical protein